MGKLSTLKQNTSGTIAALQTVLERYPVLITTDENMGKTSISFMLCILKMFGINEDDIINWLSELLADKKDGQDGLLTAIEYAIKALIIANFKEVYTCTVDPSLPDDIMYDIYDGNPRGNGIDIKIEDIDSFGLLSFCPTDKKIGNYFYFDNSGEGPTGYTPSTIYSSIDFNAFLWYVINRGSFWNENIEERLKCMWDNRFYYMKKFETKGCLNGSSVIYSGNTKYDFFHNNCNNSSLRMISGIGPKMEILTCEFKEKSNGNVINVHLNSDRYQYKIEDKIIKNKTLFQFNVDYISSLKLFNSKTLLAQTINSILGISASAKIELFSIERNVLSKQVRQIVKNIIETEDTETSNDCYFTFSNEKYEAMLEESLLNYNSEYKSKNESDKNIKYDAEKILSELYNIEPTDNLNEEKIEISNSIKKITKILSTKDEIDGKPSVSWDWGVISKSLEEIVTEITMQIMSPKLLLLFAINEKIMNPDGKKTMSGIETFLKNFKNLIISIIKEILKLIIQALYDFLMGQIRPLITIFIQKLLLETIFYYKILIQDIIETCTISPINTNNDTLTIDNVIGADIIPTLEKVSYEEECRIK